MPGARSFRNSCPFFRTRNSRSASIAIRAIGRPSHFRPSISSIPEFIHISEGKLADVNVLDLLVPQSGAFYIMDRGYLDFERLHALHHAQSFFVTRSKRGFQFQRRYSHPVDKTAGVLFDQTIFLTGFYPAKAYPHRLRRVGYYDAETDIGNPAPFSASSVRRMIRRQRTALRRKPVLARGFR